jgi:hypothetical protein
MLNDRARQMTQTAGNKHELATQLSQETWRQLDLLVQRGYSTRTPQQSRLRSIRSIAATRPVIIMMVTPGDARRSRAPAVHSTSG